MKLFFFLFLFLFFLQTQLAQQRLENVIEHLSEYYTTTLLRRPDGTYAQPHFAESNVRSLAQQLGVWPQTAVRKFQKLEKNITLSRMAMIAEDQNEQLENLREKDVSDSGGSGGGGGGGSSSTFGSESEQGMDSGVVGTTEWSEDVFVTLPPMSRRKSYGSQEEEGNSTMESSRLSILSVDGDLLDL